MLNKRILIWFHGLDDFLDCKPRFQVAGMFVQMACWAQLFIEKGYQVSSLTLGHSCKRGDISYLHWTIISKIEVLHELLGIPLILFKARPKVIIFNGASRTLFSLSFWCNILKIKLVFISASDMDFATDVGFIAGKAYNTYLYWYALKKGKIKFIVQNQQQQNDLKKSFGRDSVIVPNVWTKLRFATNRACDFPLYDVVWVANIKPLKRPEWVIEVAKRLPEYTFAMAGNCACNEAEFTEFINNINATDNIDYVGGLSFNDASNLISKSKILLCTSEFEGLPNTFLQAWQASTPIVSTVNPSNVFNKHGIGIHATKVEDIVLALHYILDDDNVMQKYHEKVKTYYKNTYETGVDLSSILDS